MKFKRFLSVLLALTMVLSYVPFGAFATETGDNVSTASTETTYVADISYKGEGYSDQTVSVNLTYDGTSYVGYAENVPLLAMFGAISVRVHESDSQSTLGSGRATPAEDGNYNITLQWSGFDVAVTLEKVEDSADPEIPTVKTVATEAELAAALAEGGDIKLETQKMGDMYMPLNVSSVLTVPADKTVNLDLNGITVMLNDQYLVNEGTLTVKNGTLAASIFNDTTNGAAIYNKGTLVVDGANVSGVCAAIRTESGKVTINGGTISATEDSGKTAALLRVKGGEVVIEGGTFVGCNSANGNEGCLLFNVSGGSVVVKGGHFSDFAGQTMPSYAQYVTISKGTFVPGTTDGWSLAHCLEGSLAPGYEVNADGAVVKTPPQGNDFTGYMNETAIWGEVWGNALTSFVIKVLDANGNVMGTTSLNNIDGIIDGDVNVTWSLNLDAASNTDAYWTMNWTTAPSLTNVPTAVQLWVDGTEVSGGNVVMNGPDNLHPVFAAKVDDSGKILSYIACDGFDLSNASAKLQSAINAGDHVAILTAGTYAVPTGKNCTITGAVDGVVFDNIGACGMHASVTFNNVTFDYYPNTKYTGLQHAGTMVYNNCTFNGQVFLYGESETFNNCTFVQTDAENYNVWTYGAKAVTFNKCTFNSAGKSVLVYNEGATHFIDLKVEDTTFNASQVVEGKAAIEIDTSLTSGANISIDADTTATGFGSGNVSGNSLWNNKMGNETAENNDVTVVVNNETVLKPIVLGLSGEGTAASPYLINNLEELVWFQKNVNSGNNYQGKVVKLNADIDLGGMEWTPISTFNGVFDGGDHTIFNLVITGNKSTVGFFGNTYNGEIKNLTIHNAKVSGRLNVGVVAGNPYTSKYTNIKVTGHVEVNGFSYVGGVGGKNAYANWTDITVDVDSTSYVKAVSKEYDPTSQYADENGYVSYRTYVGGVIGFNGEGNITFKNISSNIAVIGDVCDIGGIFGIAHYSNKFENITFTGSVTAPEGAEEVGGIAGVWHNAKGTSVSFSNVTSTGTVTVGDETTTGSIVGDAYNASNDTAENSGSLIIDGSEAWLKVASIGETKFGSLADAAAAAQAGDEIVLLDNVTVNGTLALPAGISLKSNGYTINGSIRMLGDLTLNGPLTITGGLWVGKSGETLTATLSGDKLTASYFMFQHGTYTINADIDAVYGYLSFSGTFEVNSTIHTTGTNGEVLYINGNVTLNDGAVLDSDNSVFVCNDNAVLTMKPGSKVDSKVNLTTSGAKLYIDATGMTAGEFDGITGTVTNSGTIEVVNNDGLKAEIVNNKLVLYVPIYVAAIGDEKFESLQAAIEAVEEGETIVLLSDVTVTEAAYGQNALNHARAVGFTLDLNDYTLSADTGNSVLRFNLNGSGATSNVAITIKNGKIVSGAGTWCTVMAAGIDGAKAVMNLEDLVIENNKGGDFAVKAWANGVVNAKNVTINSSFGGGFYAVGGEIVLDDCVVNQKGLWTAPYNSMAVAVSGGGKMTVNSGTYTAVPTAASEGYNQGTSHGSWCGGIMSSGGTLIINGGTFTNGNVGGTASNPRELLIIGADADYGDNVSAHLIINGGTFNSIGALTHCETIWGSANDPANTYMPTMAVTINGGDFTGVAGKVIGGNDPVSCNNPVDVEINGGIYSANHAIDKSYLHDGYVVKQNANGTYGIRAEREAWILRNGMPNYYGTLAQAVADAQNNETIILQANVEIAEVITIDKNITIGDYGNLTITPAGEGAFYLKGAAQLTLNNLIVKETPVFTDNSESGAAINGQVVTGVVTQKSSVSYDGTTVTVVNPAWVAKNGTTYYMTINEALTAAQPGDTVVIFAGTYAQGLSVTKDITVIGEGEVNFNGKLSISGNGATVKGLNFNNGGSSAGYIGAKDVLVEDCTVVGGNGFRDCYTSGTVTFKDSTITGATYGIHFDGSAGGEIVIDNCVITGWTSFASSIEKVTMTDTTFAEGNYNFIRFYQDADIDNCTFNEKMSVDVSNSVSATVKVTNSTVVNGTVEDLFSATDIDKSDIYVDGERLITPEAVINGVEYDDLAAAVAAVKDGETIELLPVAQTEGATIKLPASLKNVTIKGAEGAVLKNTTIMAADGNSISYEGLTFDGITFENSRISITGWRTGGASVKDLTVTNCVFKNLDDTSSSAPVHINMAAEEAVVNFTFTNNVIDGATGGSKSGVYAQATGNVTFTGNVINNVAFRPYIIQITTDDGIADNFVVTGNTFSGSAAGRAQGLGNNAAGTDNVNLVVSGNIFKGITNTYQICYWNFNEETTTADLSKNYYDIDILNNPSRIYYNSPAQNAIDLMDKGVYPYYADEAMTELVQAPPAIMVTYPAGNPVYPDGKIEYYNDMLEAVPYTTNCPRLEGATITLLADVSGAGMRFMENDMVFDLNGHVYTITAGTGSQGTNTSGFQIRPEVTTKVTFKNGTINVDENVPVVWMFNVYASDFIVEDVAVWCTNMDWSYGESCYVVVSRSGDNVQFTGTTSINGFRSDVAGNAINVGGTMTIGENVSIVDTIELDADATLTAREGLNVVTVDGYKVVYANGVYTSVSKTSYVTTKAELDKAIAEAIEGDVIVLANDIDYGTAQLKIEKPITLDLGGNTLTTGNNYGGMSLKDNPTIKNGNIVHVGRTAAIKAWNVASIENVNITVAANEPGKTIGGIVIQSGSTNRIGSIKNVTIQGEGLTNGIETYNCGDATENVIGSMENVTVKAKDVAMLISAPCGTATNCTFEGGKTGVELWIKGNYSATLDLVDCAVTGGEKAVYVHDEFSSNPDIVNNGELKLTADEATTFESASGAPIAVNIARAENVDRTVIDELIETTVARVGDTYYRTLDQALTAAQPGDTVVIFAGTYAQGLSVTKDITVIGEGEVNFNGKLSITGNGATVKGLNFNNGGSSAGYINAKDVLVEDCTVVGGNGFRNCYTTGTVTFKDSTITGTTYGIHFDGSADGEIVIDNCVITGWTSFAASIEKVTMTDTTFAEGNYNYIRFYQDADIDNCTFNEKMSVDISNDVSATVQVTNSTVVNGNVEELFSAADINKSDIYVDGERLITPAAEINGVAYDTFEAALNAVQDGETIVLLNVKEDESGKEIDFSKDIEFTITGNAPEFALPVITFQNATVNIKDAEILIPELDARQNATINVINSIVHDAGGNSIAKSYYNGAINISGNSVVYMMQVTTMGYITLSDTAVLNATWQTNVYGNGMITIEDSAVFNTAALHLVGKDYSGRDNTDADRVGKPAAIIVDGATVNVGKVYSDNGADYSYNSSKGVNIGTIDGKSAVLDIKNGAAFNIYLANGETANIGADGTVNVDGTVTVSCRKDGGSATLVNDGSIVVNTIESAVIANECGNVTGADVADYKLGYVDGAYKLVPKEYVAQIGDLKFEFLSEALAAVQTGENTITLLAAIDEDVVIEQVEGVNITIDGNGNVYTGTMEIYGHARYNGEETLTIKNVKFETSEAKHDFITCNTTESVKRYAHNVTVENCSFTATGDAVNSAVGLRLRQCYDILVKNSTATGLHSLIQATGGNTMVIDTVTVDGCKNGIAAGTTDGVTVKNSTINVTGYGVRADGNAASDMTVSGNTITAAQPVVVRRTTAAYDLTVTGNTLNAPEGAYQVVITEGEDDAAYVNPTGAFALASDVDTNKVYPAAAYAAQVGDYSYTSVEAALEAAENDDTVIILKDLTVENTIVVTKSVTIDLNGQTLTGSCNPVIRVKEANVTVQGGNIVNNEGYCFIVGSTDASGELTIKNGNFRASTTVASVTKGHLTIEGGYFAVDAYSGEGYENYNYLLNCIDAYYKTGEAGITVKGGSFENFNPADNAAEGLGTNFVDPLYEATTTNGVVWNVNAIAAGEIPENPIYVEWIWNDEMTEATATVSVPANATYYFAAYGMNGTVLTVNGEELEYVPGFMFFNPATFEITNGDAAEATYELKISYPIGSQNNPAELVIGDNTAAIEAGNDQGYFFTYTAPADGVLTITMPEGGWTYVINNLTSGQYGDMQWSDSDPVVNPAIVEFAAGDELQVIVNNYDPANPWNTPAGELTINVADGYPAGHEMNPIFLFAQENDVTQSGETWYQGYFSGMIMTVEGQGDFSVIYNGVTTAAVDGKVEMAVASANPRMPVIFAVVGDGEFGIDFTYPVGNMSNPAELVIGDNTAAIDAGSQGYYYTWTAEEDGELVITMPETGWMYVMNNMTTGRYGDMQWSDSDPVVNPGVIAVNKGDEVQVTVSTYDPANPWNAPAGELTVTAEFVAAPGTEVNPIGLFDQQNTVTAEGTSYDDVTYYFGYFNNMILTVEGEGDFAVIYNGESVAAVDGKVEMSVASANPRMPVNFAIDGNGDYAVNVSYPVGNMENAAQLVIGNNTASIEEGNFMGYFFSWTADKDGVLIITMPEGDWMYAINNLTANQYGDTQWSDSDPVVNPAYVNVSAGDEIQIMVNSYDPANMWSNPAAEITFVADFMVPVAKNETTGKIYGSVAEALATAKAGQTVVLTADASEDMIFVRSGITLDLNGYTLTASDVAVVNSAHIVDNSADNAGLLAVDGNHVMISRDNKQLPVRNGNGYIFVDVDVNSRAFVRSETVDGFTYMFQPIFEETARILFADGAADNELTIEVRVSWDTEQTREYRNLVFNEDQIKEVIGAAPNGAFVLNFSGFENVDAIGGATVETVINTVMGVSVVSNGHNVDFIP